MATHQLSGPSAPVCSLPDSYSTSVANLSIRPSICLSTTLHACSRSNLNCPSNCLLACHNCLSAKIPTRSLAGTLGRPPAVSKACLLVSLPAYLPTCLPCTLLGYRTCVNSIVPMHDGMDDCSGDSLVCLCVNVAQVRANAEGAQHE